MLRNLRSSLLVLSGVLLLLGCTSTDPCVTGSTGAGGEGGGGGAGGAGTLPPIVYEDCPVGITKITGKIDNLILDNTYTTTMAWVNQASPEPGLDVEFDDGGSLHVTWSDSESTWPGPTHIGGSFRLTDIDYPKYLAVRRDGSGLVTKELDGAKFHILGNQIDITGCTKAPATQK